MPEFRNSLEGGTNGTVITSANSGGTSGNAFDDTNGSPTFDNTHPGHGSLGINFTPGTAIAQVQWDVSVGTQTQFWGRAYIYIEAAPADNFTIFRAKDASAQTIRIVLRPDRTIRVANAAGAVIATTTSVVPLNTLVRLEWRVLSATTSTGTYELRYYLSPESATVTETLSGTADNFGIQATSFTFGQATSVTLTTTSMWMDDPAISTTAWIGAFGGNAVAGGPIAMSGSGTLSIVRARLDLKAVSALSGQGIQVAGGAVTGTGTLLYRNAQPYRTGTAYRGATTRSVAGGPVAMSGSGFLLAVTTTDVFVNATVEVQNSSVLDSSPALETGQAVAGGPVLMVGSGTLLATVSSGLIDPYVDIYSDIYASTSGQIVGAQAFLSGRGTLTGSGRVLPAIITPIIGFPSVIPDYQMVMYDLADAKLAELPFSDLSFSHALNEAGACSFSVPLHHPKATPGNLAPAQRKMRVFRKGKVVWGGYLWSAEAEADSPTVRCAGAGWFSRLLRRYVDEDLEFKDKDQTTIAWNLIAFTQAKESLGITRAPKPDTQVLRTRKYRPWERANIGEEIQTLTELNNGFDFSIETDPVSGLPVFEAFYPKKGSDTSTVFELGSNVGNLSYQVDGSGTISTFTGLGSGEGRNRCMAVITDVTAKADYGLLEDSEDFGNIRHYSVMADRTLEELKKRNGRRAQIQCSLQISSPGFNSYEVGDYAWVKANRGFIQIDRKMRLVVIDVNVGQEGKEVVNLLFDDILTGPSSFPDPDPDPDPDPNPGSGLYSGSYATTYEGP